jgi:hypothetical protein
MRSRGAGVLACSDDDAPVRQATCRRSVISTPQPMLRQACPDCLALSKEPWYLTSTAQQTQVAPHLLRCHIGARQAAAAAAPNVDSCQEAAQEVHQVVPLGQVSILRCTGIRCLCPKTC